MSANETTTWEYEAAITFDKRGRKIAYRWSMRQARWFRMPLAEAELAIATGKASQTTYYANSYEGHCQAMADLRAKEAAEVISCQD